MASGRPVHMLVDHTAGGTTNTDFFNFQLFRDDVIAFLITVGGTVNGGRVRIQSKVDDVGASFASQGLHTQVDVALTTDLTAATNSTIVSVRGMPQYRVKISGLTGTETVNVWAIE